FPAQGEKILVLEDVVLGCFRAEKDRVAKAFAVHLAPRQLGEDVLHRLAIVEEIVIGAKVSGNGRLLGDRLNLIAQALRALVSESELVIGRNGTIGTMKLASVCRH